jgi:hypothetical protein
MAAYYKVEVSLNTNSVTVGSPSAQEVLVTLPLVGPQGATGATGASGASTWNEISGKPATFPPSAHEHQPDEVYADAAFVSQSGDSSLQIGIYLHNGTDNGRPVYESPTTGDYIWWDSNLDQWYLTSNTDVNLYYLDENADEFPWETDVVWNAIPPQTGNIEVDQAFLSDISDYGVASVIGLKTSKSGNASSTELVLGSDTRLTNSRTPSSTLAHAASHHTGGSDALTPANIGAAPAVNVIELEADGTTTITTAQLPARGIAYADGGASFTVNLPTPDKRQSGLAFSIKTEHEAASGDVFVTVVHAAVNLLTSYELNEDEGSIDFVWDGYAWRYDTAYLLRSFPSRVLQLPAASGTIALTSDFAAPPAIGNTTPNSAAFTTLNATGTTELVNGTSAAGPFRLYNTFTDASNYERGFMRWDSNNFDIGCEADGTGTLRNVRIKTNATSGVSGTGYIEFGGSATINTIKSVGGTANGALYIYSEGTLRMLIGGSSGTRFHQTIYPNANQAIDIGLTNTRWRDVFCRSVDLTGDLILTTATGTKIGTATTQKLGFFNATPVVQQAAIADATDAATAITQLNDLLAAMRTLGLIAT